LKVAGGTVVAAATSAYFLRQEFFPSLALKSLASLPNDEGFDVCVIGSGPAGAVLARDLVDKGFRIVILESGPDLKSESFDDRIRQLEIYESSGTIPYPVAATRVRAIGGTTNAWTGICPRLLPVDFEENAYTPKGAGWPIKYVDIEPYYERAEKTLRVRGGSLSDFNAPRKTDLPSTIDKDISTIQTFLEKVDITVDSATFSQKNWIMNGPIRVARDLLPDLSASPKVTLVSGATVTGLTVDSTGRVVGARARSLKGEERIVQARTYVVACGAIETPRLLFLSRSKEFPDGIGNHSGQVGKNFMEHPNLVFFGKVPGIEENEDGDGRCYQFYQEFKERELGGAVLGFKLQSPRQPGRLRITGGIEMVPSELNRVRLSESQVDFFGNPVADLSFSYQEKDLRSSDELRSLILRIFEDLKADEVQEQEPVWSHHHIGTCRMGDDPATSVADRDLRIHETENLYVISSAVFVTSGGGNPTLTIVALAHRLADHLAAKLE
jgi:choline dehydrogenase-like flavoprotein